MKKSYYTTEPFSLGFDGEEWNAELPGLVIQTGTLTDHGRPASIVVVHGPDGYGVVSYGKWEHSTDLIMVASIVRDMLDRLQLGDGA